MTKQKIITITLLLLAIITPVAIASTQVEQITSFLPDSASKALGEAGEKGMLMHLL